MNSPEQTEVYCGLSREPRGGAGHKGYFRQIALAGFLLCSGFVSLIQQLDASPIVLLRRQLCADAHLRYGSVTLALVVMSVLAMTDRFPPAATIEVKVTPAYVW